MRTKGMNAAIAALEARKPNSIDTSMESSSSILASDAAEGKGDEGGLSCEVDRIHGAPRSSAYVLQSMRADIVYVISITALACALWSLRVQNPQASQRLSVSDGVKSFPSLDLLYIASIECQ